MENGEKTKRKRRSLEQQIADLKHRMASDTDRLMARESLQLAIKMLNARPARFSAAVMHMDAARELTAKYVLAKQEELEPGEDPEARSTADEAPFV